MTPPDELLAAINALTAELKKKPDGALLDSPLPSPVLPAKPLNEAGDVKAGAPILPELKPGWKTSELWTAVAAQIIPALFALNVLKNGDVATTQSAVNTIIQSVFAIVGSVAPLINFARVRMQAKTDHAAVITALNKETK